MTTVTVPTPTLAGRPHSHSVREGNNYRNLIEKEEVFLEFHTTWRGVPCRVTMSADWYRHSSGISEWRIYATDVRESSDEQPYGPTLSDTARRRLSDICTPLTQNWLDSTAYRASEQRAYAHMILDKLRELRPYDYGHGAARDVRRMVDQYRAKLPATLPHKLLSIADAYDTFTKRYDDAHAQLDNTS